MNNLTQNLSFMEQHIIWDAISFKQTSKRLKQSLTISTETKDTLNIFKKFPVENLLTMSSAAAIIVTS